MIKRLRYCLSTYYDFIFLSIPIYISLIVCISIIVLTHLVIWQYQSKTTTPIINTPIKKAECQGILSHIYRLGLTAFYRPIFLALSKIYIYFWLVTKIQWNHNNLYLISDSIRASGSNELKLMWKPNNYQ